MSKTADPLRSVRQPVEVAATAPAMCGSSFPIGATVVPGGGVNFSVFSRHATGMQLLLFDCDDDQRPSRVIGIEPQKAAWGMDAIGLYVTANAYERSLYELRQKRSGKDPEAFFDEYFGVVQP